MKNKSFNIANMPKYGYAVDLSKSNSVTPQRHCGFIVPKFCLASQAVQETSASISAMQTRLYSLYEGMTQQNKSAMANMLGGYFEAESESPHHNFSSYGESQKLKTNRRQSCLIKSIKQLKTF